MKSLKYILPALLLISISACKKEFLESKPNQALLVPTKVSDMRAILDNNGIMNATPIYTLVASDDLSSNNPALSLMSLGAYTWTYDWTGQLSQDWNIPWTQIFYSNIVLDGLDRYKENASKEAGYSEVKGDAFFFRGLAYFNLLQQFCEPYRQASASATAGLPLRLESDVNKNPPRSRLDESYAQVVKDFVSASELLPATVQFKTRPTKAAAFGMLARTFLSMNDFAKAEEFSGKALSMDGNLIDFNSLNPSAARPFPMPLVANNPEVVFYGRNIIAPIFTDATTVIPDSLYNRYSGNDLRKIIYFTNNGIAKINFKGSFTGAFDNFTGIANDELYLIRAESLARNGKLSEALNDLNTLLAKRMKLGSFVPYSNLSKTLLLDLILKERNKELVFRNTRWTDLRRLNSYDKYGYVLTRTFAGTTFKLLPNSVGYVFPIPPGETMLSGLQ